MDARLLSSTVLQVLANASPHRPALAVGHLGSKSAQQVVLLTRPRLHLAIYIPKQAAVRSGQRITWRVQRCKLPLRAES